MIDNEKLDALIIGATSDQWTKVAVIIAKTYDAYEAAGEELTKGLAQKIASRVYKLVEEEKLSAQGNIRRWREGDVKLVDAG